MKRETSVRLKEKVKSKNSNESFGQAFSKACMGEGRSPSLRKNEEVINMIWPYIVLSVFFSVVKSFLEATSVNVIFIYIIEIIDTLCLMVIEYRLINRYVKIRFFENKTRLKMLIVCQFILIEIINVFRILIY